MWGLRTEECPVLWPVALLQPAWNIQAADLVYLQHVTGQWAAWFCNASTIVTATLVLHANMEEEKKDEDLNQFKKSNRSGRRYCILCKVCFPSPEMNNFQKCFNSRLQRRGDWDSGTFCIISIQILDIHLTLWEICPSHYIKSDLPKPANSKLIVIYMFRLIRYY